MTISFLWKLNARFLRAFLFGGAIGTCLLPADSPIGSSLSHTPCAESCAGSFSGPPNENARLRGHFYLAEWTGLAYILQAADSLISESLLVPPKAAQAAFSSPQNENARLRGHFYLAEWTGLEPATPGVTGRYSNQLNYHSNTLICASI